MNGRDFELWQPLLAVAAWLESLGAKGLLKLMQGHALATIDAAKDDQVGDADEILLRILTEKRLNCETPQPKEIYAIASGRAPKRNGTNVVPSPGETCITEARVLYTPLA